MRAISHRGNIDGPNPSSENDPGYLLEAISLGYYVEIDVWKEGSSFCLGHDAPSYEVEKFFLFNDMIYAHCKNKAAFEELSCHSQLSCFFHDADALCMTTKGEMIYHGETAIPSSPARPKSIAVKLDDPLSVSGYYGVITDFPSKLISTVVTPPFDLLVLDIDGVMTDGTKTYGRNGKAFSKRYCDRDFTAIKRFKAAGVEVVFLSGDKSVNEAMARRRHIDFYHSRDEFGNIDKSRFIPQLRSKYGARRIAYVGDDYYDLSILDRAEISFCPSDAIQDVLNSADVILGTRGGEGVVAELFEWARPHLNLRFPR